MEGTKAVAASAQIGLFPMNLNGRELDSPPGVQHSPVLKAPRR